ncbi:MAG: TatD family hydrolase [Gammaproteobacteria bacterium]|nr:TatD family hydrolase [Gammaproteobacteria bacterium]
MHLFDSHCHLDVEEFDTDRAQVLHAARAAGVAELMIPAVKRATWQSLLDFCAGDDRLYPALGLHPVYLSEHRLADVDALAEAVARVRPVAIGEIGLDWYVRELDRERQQQLFEAQLAVAEANRLPVILHVRKAHDAMLQTLRRFDLCGGICHAFNGSEQQASQYIDKGFCLGLGGMITFERSTRLRRLAIQLPLDSIVLETDAPDMTVASHRFERNSPAYLPEVCTTLATLRKMDPADIADQTTRNARRVLSLVD